MDRFEQNDTAATAFNLGTISGTRTESSLDLEPNDPDWYRFTLSGAGRTGDRIGVNFAHALGDLDIELYAADGTTLLDYSESIDDNEELSLAQLAAGTYVLKVYGYAGASNANYALTIVTGSTGGVSGDRFENNDDPTTATPLGTINGTFSAAQLSVEADDDDWYRFALGAAGRSGDEISITFSHAAGDLDLVLFDAAGTLVGVSDSTSSNEGIDLAGLAAGSYYALVYGYDGAANPSYTLTIATAPTTFAPDSLEQNDSAGAATNLGSISGTVTRPALTAEPNDDDWFKFTLPGAGRSGDQVAITFNNALGDLDLLLYGSNGTTLLGVSDGTGDAEQISLAGLPAGTYYAQVYGYDGASNPAYTLAVTAAPTVASADRFEQNDSAAAAKDLGMIGGSVAEAQLSVEANDPDWYRFSIPITGRSGDKVGITFNHALGDLDLVLYASNGTTVLGASSSTGNAEDVSLAGIAAGSYYLKVFGYNGAANPGYTLAFTAAPATTSADRFEPNDAAAQATNLRTISGTLAEAQLNVEANDPDWYRFTLGAAGRSGDEVGIAFNHALGDLDLVLYARDGTTVLGSSTGTSNAEAISLAGLAAGEYYAKVFGYGGAANPGYTLSVTAAPATTSGDRFEHNDTAATATDLRTVNGTLDEASLSVEANDPDWFRFTLATSGRSGDQAAITFNHAAGDLDLALYASNGTSVLGVSEGTANGEQISLAGLAAGTYLVKVYGYGGAANASYTLALTAAPTSGLAADAWEVNNTSAQATQIRQAQQTFDNATITAGDHDWYTFTLPAAGALADRVSLAATGGDVDLKLFNAQGVQVGTTSQSNANGQAALALANVPAGQYFVNVAGRTAATQAEYDLDVRAAGTATTGGQDTWTVLVYIAGDNNLEDAAVGDVNEMEAAVMRAGLNVGVQFDRIPGFDASNGNWTDTRRGVITRDNNTAVIGSSLVSIGEIDMGRQQSLTDFINWGAANLPAQHYALVIWDHGGGPIYGSAWDDSSGTSNLSDQEVRQAIAASTLQRVDLLGFDACLMAAVETASSLAPVAQRLVASERIEPGEGWDYTAFLNRFSSATSADVSTLAAAIVDTYGAFHGPAYTLSAVDLGLVAPVETAINGFVNVMRSASAADWAAVRTAHSRSQTADPDYAMYVDLVHFMNNLDAASSNAALDTAARAVAQAAQAAVLRDFSPSTFFGLTVVLTSTPSSYSGYEAGSQRFLANTTWDDFLALYAQNRAQGAGGAARALPIDTSGADYAERYDLGGNVRLFNNDTLATSYELGTINLASYAAPSLTIDTAGDVDWFRFTLPSGTGYAPTLTVQATNAGGVSARLHNATQQLVAEATTAAGTGTLTFNQLAAGGSYFVELRAVGSALPVYDLRINAFGNAAPPADPLPDHAEAGGGNNSRVKATVLGDAAAIARIGGVRNLTFNAADLQGAENGGDWFRVDSARTTESNANRVAIAGAAGGDLDLRVYDVNGNLLAESASSGSSAETLAFARQTTDVYVQVYSRGSAATTSYTLEVWHQLDATLSGSAGNDNLVDASGAGTLLRGLAGNDRIDGRDGIDTAGYTVARSAATFGRSSSGGGWIVDAGADGQDALANVERLRFTDRSVALDLSGNAGAVAKILGAVFGRTAVANKEYAGIGLYYMDGGMSYEALMQAAIAFRLGAGLNNGAVVDLLYMNVVGIAPPAAERPALVALLDSGAYTVGGLGVFAAETSLNTANINLVGLEQQGLEYTPFAG